ncbi:MAG: hypothetical protein FD147_2477 [Chloroflexi bacterium]|nr:MAG: hypothetical protein FD147_2477 [Chloroflexota bacterium]MBA4376752.1 hypothetical protein [Anaerolinea sp.]
MALYVNIILVVSIWMAFMGLGITLSLCPSIVKVTKKLVCPSGSQMRVEVKGQPYRSVYVYYTDENGVDHGINGRAIAVLWGIFFLVSLPISALVVLFINKWINST